MATATATASSTATTKKMFIDGQWCDAQDGKTVGIINPATEEIIVEMAFGSRADVRRAIEAAGKAMPAWMKLTAYDRAKVLKKTAELMRERADAIARTLTMEQGKPLAEAKAEVLHSADTFEWFAEEGKRAYGQVIPQFAAGQAARDPEASGRRRRGHQPVEFPDHAASAQDRPGPGGRLHHRLQARERKRRSALVQVFECMIDAGLPAGVANLVMGPAQEVADEFLENPIVRKISFTGSTEVGKQLMKRARRSGQAHQPGARRPRSVHRLPRCRPGSRRQARRHGQVPQQRPGLHRPEPILRA